MAVCLPYEFVAKMQLSLLTGRQAHLAAVFSLPDNQTL